MSRRRAAAGQAGPALPPSASPGPERLARGSAAARETRCCGPERRQPPPSPAVGDPPRPPWALRGAAQPPARLPGAGERWQRRRLRARCLPPALHSPDAPARRRGSAPSRPRPCRTSISAAEAPPPPPHAPPAVASRARPPQWRRVRVRFSASRRRVAALCRSLSVKCPLVQPPLPGPVPSAARIRLPDPLPSSQKLPGLLSPQGLGLPWRWASPCRRPCEGLRREKALRCPSATSPAP